MPTGIPAPSFTSGEISPSLYGRVDIEFYYKGLRTCRNMIPSKYGGVDNRPGTRFLTAVLDSSKPVRLIPFQFNEQQTYVLELGHLTMRVIANGAVVPVDPAIVTPWDSADLFMLKFIQNADVITVCHPNYPPMQIKRYSETLWAVENFEYDPGPFLDINVDGGSVIHFTAIKT